MTDNVIIFNGITRHDLPVERLIDRAQEAELESVVIIGWTPEGELYFASSKADGPNVLWLLEKAKKELLSV